jgi:hypothetical protein
LLSDDLMTVLDRALAWWRGQSPVPDRRTIADPTPQPQRVPAEFRPLYTYLEARYATTVVLTFEQMEALMGHALPDPARTERDWWTSGVRSGDRHSDAWTMARRTAVPNLSARTVTFERLP